MITLSFRPAIILTACLVAGLRLTAATYYVAPEGNDAWTGLRQDGPVATLARVQALIRSVQPLKEPVTVELADGVYRLDEPLIFTPADSGTAQCSITYRAAPGTHPRFTSERPVVGWQVRPDGLWAAPVPARGKIDPVGEQLWIDGRLIPLARIPASGLATMAAVTETALNGETPIVTSEGKRTSLHHARLSIRPVHPELFAPLAALSPEELRQIRMVAYHAWDVTIRFLHEAAPGGNELTLLGTGQKYVNPLKTGSTFYLENVPTALTEPGTCSFSAGEILYHPRPSEKIDRIRATVPTLQRLLIFTGTSGGAHPVEHLSFADLSFAESGWTLPAAGFDPIQSAGQLGAAIEADFTQDIAFHHCNFERLSGYALWFRRGCRRITVESSYFADLGAGAIRVGETPLPQTRPAPSGADRTGWITLDNNIITRGGQLFAGSTGIFIGRSGHNTVTHNDLSHLTYMGVSLGWSWGYTPDDAASNVISYNRIAHLGGTGLSDLAGIYTLGPTPDTVCAHNVIFDVKCADYGGWGLYNDEGATGVTMRDNLVYDCESGGYHLHFGEHNAVVNNIFAFGSAAEIVLSTVDGHDGLTFAHNLVIWRYGPLFGTAWADGRMTRESNLYWRMDGEPVRFGSLNLTQWEATGRESASLVADPGLIDPDRRNFYFRSDAPVAKIGFVPFNPAEAGVYGSAQWRQLAGAAN